jgi:membrane protein required for colicin V production
MLHLLNVLDWVLLGAGAFSVLRGLMRGAISQIFGIAGILGGFIVASHNYQYVGAELTRNFPSIAGASTVGFIVLFLVTWFCISIAGHFIVRIVRKAGLGFLDRLWGAMIGFGKALLLAIAIISILTMFAADNSPLLTKSVLVPYVKEASLFLFKLAPGRVQDEFLKRQKDLEHFLPGKLTLPKESVGEPAKGQKGKSDAKSE